jgi:ribonuclease HI
LPNVIEFRTDQHIWTDGSLFTDTSPALEAGAAIIRNGNNPGTNEMFYTTPNTVNPSSTTTEIAAIHIPLQIIPKNTQIKIYADSQSTIDSMYKLNSKKLTERAILKIPNHLYLQLNQYYYNKFY